MQISRRAFISSALGTVLGVGFIIKERFGGKKYTYKTDAIRNKLVIVTGATSGIGKATAKELALRKAKVILACRDIAKCEKMRLGIILACKNKKIECRELDLASQKSIRKFVDEFNKKYPKLDILINNAGVLGGPRAVTSEGIEMQLGVNHMGHFLLTNLLLPKLKIAAPSRIINITSIDYQKGIIDKEDLNMTKNYDSMKAYKQSKLASVLFTLELAKRLEGTGVTVNAVYPGIVNTKLLRNTSFYKSYISSIILKPFLWMFIKNTKQGSQPIIYAAAEPSIEKESGVLFGHNFEKKELTIPEHEDNNIQLWLWRVSEKWTNLISMNT